MHEHGAQPPALAIDDHGTVQVWTMQLAPVNAINSEMISSIELALDAAKQNESIAAVVLRSGLRVFSAGADATWMARTLEELGPQGLLENFKATMDRFREVCARLRSAPFLVIAALNGHTLAGGLELAAASDLRFCADRPQLTLGAPEMDLFGCLPSGAGGAQFLTRLLGPSQALMFMLGAKAVDPSRALALGLVDRLCDDGELESSALDFATEVANKAGRIGVSCAKRAVFTAGELALPAALEMDASLHWDTMRRGNFLSSVETFAAQFGSKSAR